MGHLGSSSITRREGTIPGAAAPGWYILRRWRWGKRDYGSLRTREHNRRGLVRLIIAQRTGGGHSNLSQSDPIR